MRRKLKIAVALAVFIAASALWAIRVSPGSFSTQNIPMGRAQDLGITLVCSAEGANFVLISVASPDAMGLPHCVGYRPIPDVDWFITDGDSLPTDSTGTARSKMAINVPDRPQLYNQHFIVRLFVTSSASGMFQLAIMPYYFVETPPLENPPVPPEGKLAVAPSIVEMDADNSTGSFVLFNNDSIEHKYTLTVRSPQRTSRRFPNLSPGYTAIGDSSVVIVAPGTLKIIGGERSEISLRWTKAAAIRTPTEAIILIAADSGETNFVRMKMKLNVER